MYLPKLILATATSLLFMFPLMSQNTVQLNKTIELTRYPDIATLRVYLGGDRVSDRELQNEIAVFEEQVSQLQISKGKIKNIQMDANDLVGLGIGKSTKRLNSAVYDVKMVEIDKISALMSLLNNNNLTNHVIQDYALSDLVSIPRAQKEDIFKSAQNEAMEKYPNQLNGAFYGSVEQKTKLNPNVTLKANTPVSVEYSFSIQYEKE